jgi:hypothetical protein
LLSLYSVFVLTSGDALMKLFHFHRQIPLIEGIKALCLVLSQFLLLPFKFRLSHEKSELAPTQNPIKVYGMPLTGGRGAQSSPMVLMDTHDSVVLSVTLHVLPP